jgi:membrane protein
MSIIGTIRKHLIQDPTSPRGWVRLRRSWKFLRDLVRHCVNELMHDNAEQMAAALTYRTIFSLVPILVLSLLVFNAFGGFKDKSAELQDWILNYMGLGSFNYVQPVESAPNDDTIPANEPADHGERPSMASPESLLPDTLEPPPGVVVATSQPSTQTATQPASQPATTQPNPTAKLDEQQKEALALSIKQYIADFMSNVQGVKIGAIGSIGLLLFIWGALGLAISIETNFNTIYNAPTGRPWHMRVMIYWSVITLGPVLLFVSLYVVRRLQNQVTQLESIDYIGPVVTLVLLIATKLVALFATWLLLFLLYRLMPNTKVRWRPALIGSLLAALFWEAGKWGFGLYVESAVTYNIIYGALGLVPLFFLWLYVTWVIVLFGLELSYTLQVMKSGNFKYAAARAKTERFYDPRWVIPMMGVIGKAFLEGVTITADKIAAELSLPVRVIVCLGEDLEKAGLVHRTQPKGEEDPGYTLAMPPDKIQVAHLVEISGELAKEEFVETPTRIERRDLPGWTFLDDLTQAQKDRAAKATLATLIAKPETGAAAV